MKVGILTFHRAHNFGAMLQCYALQEYLTKKGLNVEVIDYRQPYIETLYSKYSDNSKFHLSYEAANAQYDYNYFMIEINWDEDAEFIENSNSWTIHVKNLEDEEEQWIDLCYVCTTKEEAYTKLLTLLECEKQYVEDALEDAKEELIKINIAIKNLKQKYEI